MYAIFCQYREKGHRETHEFERVDIYTKKYRIVVTTAGVSVFRKPRPSKKHPGKTLGEKEKYKGDFNFS